MCSSPVEVIATSLLANGAPDAIVKVLLYPGLTFSRVESVVADTEPFAFPDWDNILKDANMSDKGHLQNSVVEFGLEAGCYLSVVGTIFTILGVAWVSACGMVIVLWYIYTLGGKENNVFALPMFTLAMVCAMAGCVNLDRFLKKGETTEHSSINNESASKESTVEESTGEELTRKQSTRKTSSSNAKKRR
jgi:hypothetical protein